MTRLTRRHMMRFLESSPYVTAAKQEMGIPPEQRPKKKSRLKRADDEVRRGSKQFGDDVRRLGKRIKNKAGEVMSKEKEALQPAIDEFKGGVGKIKNSINNPARTLTKGLTGAAKMAGRAGKEAVKGLATHGMRDVAGRATDLAKRVIGTRSGERFNVEDIKPEIMQKIINKHKYINNKLLIDGLKSTKLTGLPTTAEGKASGRFGIVDDQGRPVYIFYPYTTRDSQVGKDDDSGFVLWDVQNNQSQNIDQKLSESEYADDPNFVSFENSISSVPHYTK